MTITKVAVITSGGDAPGMNSAIYGCLMGCLKKNIELVAAIGGFDGLIDDKFVIINHEYLEGQINDGGSAIKSCRSPRFMNPTFFNRALKNLKNRGINHIIVIGGDGSFNGSMRLTKAGVNVITIPGTIDNDLNFTHTLGYDSATNNIVNAVDNIYDSISSFYYGAVIKVMGRHCPDLLLAAAKAIHTEYIITKKDDDLDKLAAEIKKNIKKAKPYPIILVLEDIMDVVEVANILEEKCKIPMRPHILGYIQRGGKPSAFDRAYGYQAGMKAVECILKGESGISIGMNDNVLTKISFAQALDK